jgi:hypothetical protein
VRPLPTHPLRLAPFAAHEHLQGNPTGTSDSARAKRVSGVSAYRVRSASWKVRRGPTAGRRNFDVELDVVVFNPIEEIHLRGHVVGDLSTKVTIVDCPDTRFSRQAVNPACR